LRGSCKTPLGYLQERIQESGFRSQNRHNLLRVHCI
jgi:hypothetical protein